MIIVYIIILINTIKWINIFNILVEMSLTFHELLKVDVRSRLLLLLFTLYYLYLLMYVWMYTDEHICVCVYVFRSNYVPVWNTVSVNNFSSCSVRESKVLIIVWKDDFRDRYIVFSFYISKFSPSFLQFCGSVYQTSTTLTEWSGISQTFLKLLMIFVTLSSYILIISS